jgi:phospholipid N-methyltransferase
MRQEKTNREQIERAKSRAMLAFVLGPVKSRTAEQAYVHRTMTRVFRNLNKSES